VALLNASRRKRIADGSGTSVQEVNKLVKQYQDMAKMMKRMGKMTGGNPAALAQMLGGGGGMPSDSESLPPSGLPGMGGGLPGGMGGLGGGLGGRGGFPGGLPGLGMPRGGKKKKR